MIYNDKIETKQLQTTLLFDTTSLNKSVFMRCHSLSVVASTPSSGIIEKLKIFNARRYASAVYAVTWCLSVYQLHQYFIETAACITTHLVPQRRIRILVSDANDLGEN